LVPGIWVAERDARIHRLFLGDPIELRELLGDVSENRKRSERGEVMLNGDE